MSIFHRSSSGSPSTIHCASWRPSPPAPAMPCALKPAATNRPRTSDSPRMNSLSGREPLRAVDQLRDARVVHGRHAPHRPGADLLEARPVRRQQLAVEVGRDAVERPGRRVALVAAHHQAAHLRAGSRRGCPGRAAAAGPACTPSIGSVTRYWWAKGMTGTVMPAMRPISGANMPPALTTTSASISAAVGLDGPHPTALDARSRSRGCARRSGPAAARAPAASAWVRPLGSR